ncbi:serine endopeptidase [Chryseobacterium carnipullorum]|uniref:Serine endopeptidase n=1 Tax=Chryseobacterium carnipullorum TaxID=1124835 RepID=A0A1M7FKA0_CHRCU|nr:microviridin/marinostatin family tricyclic proteinase inhibitor [Chryseobacterium carnipullorum]MDN5396300.1 microviridin/marinostatin family tricyclic proteinase inhibitor [Chryseobacterium sp.]AZA49131.1 serine endopeptidase [Chryseobacterium carnipullorum]AZA64025.1 serine endopeptidase [Chryseobacterium carnipullorum]MDN5477163.1 microviridin/marinostatin family tricyclic proteinase inhibitor [Chryseobacterium sp.]SHM04443.1 Serine endopeptidase inhibitors [Chryseobacterium carnipulloru
MKDENSKKKPFFASFLEKQIKDPETVQGGGGVITNTDNDIITAPSVDNVTAQIFDHVTSPNKDLLVTMKYPSDGDDSVI